MQTIIINMDIWNLKNKIYGVNEKGGNKRKGIKERKRNKGKKWDREKKELKSTGEIRK